VIAVVKAPRLGSSWREPLQGGTDTQVLREGLGLYTGSPQPGSRGNVGIAGHRTTWGAPFKHINEFRRGDLISIWTARGRFDYSVVSTGVTVPSDTSVIDQGTAHGTAMLTLTTCHPEFSARERLYVHAVLIRSTSSV
jgi:sortase A